jgi:hypothetical protein
VNAQMAASVVRVEVVPRYSEMSPTTGTLGW